MNKPSTPRLKKKYKVKCPRCGKRHTWPTEDKLCRKCEGEWAGECKEMSDEAFEDMMRQYEHGDEG